MLVCAYRWVEKHRAVVASLLIHQRRARTLRLANTMTFLPVKSSADMYGTRPLKIVRGPSGSPTSISSMYCARRSREASVSHRFIQANKHASVKSRVELVSTHAPTCPPPRASSRSALCRRANPPAVPAAATLRACHPRERRRRRFANVGRRW